MHVFAPDLVAPAPLFPGEIRFHDLVGVPWRANGTSPREGFDCATLSYVCQARCGIRLPLSELWFCPDDEDERAAAFADYLEAEGHRWTHLGTRVHAATQLGDVILTQGEGEEGLHVATVVSTAQHLALTTYRETGSMVIRSGLLPGVVQVMRWRG